MKPSIRCSALPHLLACPGSRTLIERLAPGKDEGSAVTHEGNWGHHNVATRLVTIEGAVAPEAGIPAPKCPANYKPSPFARWMADFCFYSSTDQLDDSWALSVEHEFAEEFDRFILTGHIDLMAVRLEKVEGESQPQVVEAVITDFKFGAIPVDPAPENEQVMGYAVHPILEYPYLRKLTCRIVQPRNDDESEIPRISSVTIEGEASLKNSLAFVENRLNAALDKPMEVETGRQCRYCPAALQCPAMRAEMDSFMKLQLTKAQVEAVEPECPMTRLIEIYDARKSFAPVLESGYGQLKERIHANGDIAIFPDGRCAKIKPRGGKRKITDNASGWAILAELPDPLRLTCFEFKPGNIETAYAEHFKCPMSGKKPVTAEKLFEEKLGAITEQAQSLVLTVE